jgi:heme/copper-type cytochrome/quinol oxidase subunit 2
MQKFVLASLAILSVILLTSLIPSYAQTDATNPALPAWIKNNFKWYSEGAISEGEVVNSIKYLAENNVIRLEQKNSTAQFMQQVRQNPSVMQNWMDSMMSDPQLRNQMMQNWNQHMTWNPNHMQNWMGPVMDDPTLRQQMYESMFSHQRFMQGMMDDPTFQNQWMGQGMMGQGMMGGHMMSNYGTQTQSLPTGNGTKTFDISLEEVEFYATVENEEGQEETAFVELHRWEPNIIIVNQGDEVTLNISNPRKHAHTFSIPDFGVNTSILEPREGKQTVTFVADQTGVFTFYCGLPYNPDRLYCDPDHSMMTGTLIVLE